MIIRHLTRQEVIEQVKELQAQGYQYIVRDEGSEWVMCFSTRPIKYKDTGWGYPEKDIEASKMAYPMKNLDILEINSTNRPPVTIQAFLESQA